MIASCNSSPLRLVILSATACNCCTAWAAGGAHEHGAAELLLSSEGRDVQIIFNAPAQSLVGFETAAVTVEQKAAVARAEAILMAPRDLFALKGNSCVQIDATVDVSSLVSVGNAPSQPEGHADHSDEHADDHDEHRASTSDKHAHEHHDHDDDVDAPDADSHSDVSASYTLECQSDEALTRITFNRDGFPFGLERIDVLWVADWGQGAGQATPQSPSVNLQN
jgi:hypothetical protein